MTGVIVIMAVALFLAGVAIGSSRPSLWRSAAKTGATH